jgi:hypothetical protein
MLFGPRARRFYYMLARIAALVIAVFGGAIGIVASVHGYIKHALLDFSIMLLAIGFVAHADRRTKELEEEEVAEAAARAEGAVERWEGEGRSTFVAHIRLRTYLLSAVVVLIFLAGVAFGVLGKSLLFTAISGAALLATLPRATKYFRNHEALVIGPLGIDDRLRYGLIPWSDIRAAHLFETETRGVRIAELMLEVKDRSHYSARQGFASRLLGSNARPGNTLRVPLQILDLPAQTIISIARMQHEKVAPQGSLLGSDAGYAIDESWAKVRTINDRSIAMMKTLSEEKKQAQQDPRFESDHARKAVLEAKVNRTLGEIERLQEESMKLANVQAQRFTRRAEDARKQLRRVTVIFTIFVVVMVAAALFRLFAR